MSHYVCVAQTAQSPSVGSAPMRGRNRWAVLTAVGVGLAAIGVASGLSLTRGGHPGGDPGGQILRALRPVTDALPADAKVMNRFSNEPYWDDCQGGESYSCTRPGWGLAGVDVQFTTATSAGPLLQHANSVLTAKGWCLSARESSPLGPVLTWAMAVPGGKWGWVTLGPGDMGPGSPLMWNLAASAPAIGHEVERIPLSSPPCLPHQP